MRRAVATAPLTYLRRPVLADAEEFVTRATESHGHLRPFVHAAEDLSEYRSWIARDDRPDTAQFLVCRRSDDAIVGFVNLNTIFLGALQSASIGWASFRPHVGAGHLTEGVELALRMAFTSLRLHRVEANIQPANERSRDLALRCGFSLEGFSPKYLKIGGRWRDHERWAVVVDDWRARQRPSRSAAAGAAVFGPDATEGRQ